MAGSWHGHALLPVKVTDRGSTEAVKSDDLFLRRTPLFVNMVSGWRLRWKAILRRTTGRRRGRVMED